ncbi:MAG: MOSC domain-containing protein [Thiohalobacteraceae bacterium]
MDSIQGLYTGSIAALGERTSAIAKRPIQSAELTPLGLRGDQQADRVNHGGPERALLQYCARHYADWRRELPAAATLAPPGFGENLSAALMDEDNVCIGDIYQIGGARVQVSQPRSPCWKLNARSSIPDLALRVQDSARCGWLYRVLVPGRVTVGDAIELLERPHPDMTVATLMRAVYRDAAEPGLLERIAALAELSPNWRDKAKRRATGETLATKARLQGGPS